MSENCFVHKGFIGEYHYSEDENKYIGTVKHMDGLEFDGENLAMLEEQFCKTVDEHFSRILNNPEENTKAETVVMKNKEVIEMCIKKQVLISRSELPSGWCKGLVQCLEEDLKNVIQNHNVVEFEVTQAKEKYGSLRIYYGVTYGMPDSDYNPSNDIDDIINKYEHVSSRTCCLCGKFPVPVTNDGWIMPLCKECFDSRLKRVRKYEDVITDDSEFNPNLEIKIYRRGQNLEKMLDTSDIIERVRKWRETNARTEDPEEES